jgi:hypothetical protein
LLLPVRFPGQYYDPETDLNENWNRFYDPNTGRYLEPDPALVPTARLDLGFNVLMQQLLKPPLVNTPPQQDDPQRFGADALAFKEPFRPAALRGQQEMVYGYAADNPETFTDPSGDAPGGCLTTYDCCLQAHADEGWEAVEEHCGPQPPNCRSQKAFCVLKCNATHPPSPGRCNQGQPTLKCISECMVENGCNG